MRNNFKDEEYESGICEECDYEIFECRCVDENRLSAMEEEQWLK